MTLLGTQRTRPPLRMDLKAMLAGRLRKRRKAGGWTPEAMALRGKKSIKILELRLLTLSFKLIAQKLILHRS